MSASVAEWKIGQEVVVASRTWPGINKPGGHGKIININYSSLGVVDTLDVRYTLGKTIDTNLDTDLVKPHIELSRGRRSRKGRDFLAEQYNQEKNTPHTATIEVEKENEIPRRIKKAKTSNKAIHLEPSQLTKKPTTKKVKNSKPDDKPRPEESSKTKRNKLKGNPMKTNTKTNRATPSTTTTKVCEPSDIPKDIPRVVHSNFALAPGDLSPLGPLTNCGTSKQYNSVSEEEQASGVADRSIDRLEKRNTEEAGTFERKTMQSIFDEQMQEAACYVDSLVGGKKSKQCSARPPEDSKPVAAPASATSPLDEKRFAEFGKVFSNAMRYNDFIHENMLFDNVNELCPSYDCKSFTKEELKEFVARLVAEDKVMLSDGYFYPI